MAERLLTSGQVAEICQVSVPTVLNWINSDQLSSYKTAGGHNRLSPLGLIRFLARKDMFVPGELYDLAGIDKDTFHSGAKTEKPVAIVADDDSVVRRLLTDILKSIDYVVVEVADGMEACLQMGLLRPELLILDILMPEMDGIQVVHTIKKQPELSGTNIIIVSGQLDPDKCDELRNSGIEHIFQKPLPVAEFVRIAKDVREAFGAI